MRKPKPHNGLRALAVVTGVALATSVCSVASADDTTSAAAVGIQAQHPMQPIKPADKIAGSLGSASGAVSVFIQFSGQGAFDATQPAAVKQGKSKPVSNPGRVRQIRNDVEAKAKDVAQSASASELYTTSNTIPGVAVHGDATAIRALADRADVVKLTPIVTKHIDNKSTDIDTKALDSWVQKKQTGQGVTIAVIDTGLDYTHADFGGPGTADAYAKAKALTTFPAGTSGLLDPKKVIGGYDLVGDDYNADPAAGPAYQPVPHPDGNPLDCAAAGHGTHVAGTAGGYGVNTDGSTFTGDYGTLTSDQVNAMRIGPGSAPQAQLVSLRVFGCSGSSDVVGQALDMSLDPNGDGNFDDRANVINMSLGSDGSPTDDPENDIVDNLTQQGILSVVASGNAGDVYDIGGSPGNARSALTVANSVGSQVALDKVDVLAPAEVAGEAQGQYSVNFNYAAASQEALTGDVVMAPTDNKFGCDPFPAGSLNGKWVWLVWEENGSFPCGSGKRFNYAQAAGAKGVVLDSPRDVFEAGIAGNTGIPGVQFNRTSSDKLRPAAAAGTLKIRLDPAYTGTVAGPSNALDTLNSSSSRGDHGSNGIVKPDVAAPGTLIASAAAGSGNLPRVMSGTSMATPHVAGIAALLYGATDYTPMEVKSAIMNTANIDVLASNGKAYGPNRVGSGRVVALDALNTPVLAFAADDPALTSVNFGVVEVGSAPVTVSKKVSVVNKSNTVLSYAASYLPASAMPGVSYTVTPTVSVPAKATGTVVVTMTIADPNALAKTLDPTMDADQLGVARQFIADASGRIQLQSAGQPTLRVPVYAAPKPVSAMTAGKQVSFKNPNATDATVTLSGRGVDQGAGASRYQSLVAPFELGASSPRKPDSKVAPLTNRSMDLQYVGASSTVPMLAKSGGDVQNGMISFGISTWGNWASILGASEIDVQIDTNGDGKPDYQMVTGTGADLDLLLVDTYKLNADGSASFADEQFANGVEGNVDTNTMDTNTVVLPVSAAALGLDLTKSAPISYRVLTSSAYSTNKSGALVPVDTTPWIGYNPVTPKVWFEGSAASALFVDAPGATLTVHHTAKDMDSKALFLHLHNATGALDGSGRGASKAEVLPLKVGVANGNANGNGYNQG